MSTKSPTTYKVAELLHKLGWNCPCDAQFARLDAAIGDGRLLNALFGAESIIRDQIAAGKSP